MARCGPTRSERRSPGSSCASPRTARSSFRSPGAFQAYYKNPEATARGQRAGRLGRTPATPGFSTRDGQLTIIDRARDVGRLARGALFAPKFIENKLKFFPYIKEAVAFGDGRDFVTAFINIDLEAVGNWAERQGLAYGSYQELAADERVYQLIADMYRGGEPRSRRRAEPRRLADPPLPDPAQGAGRRRRRADPHPQGAPRHVAERYAPLIEALYSTARVGHIETEVTFEDGRKGSMQRRPADPGGPRP